MLNQRHCRVCACVGLGAAACSAVGQPDVTLLAQARSLRCQASGHGAVEADAADFAPLYRTVSAFNSTFGGSAVASQRSVLGTSLIESVQSSSAYGGLQVTGGSSSSHFAVTFRVGPRAVVASLIGEWRSYYNSQGGGINLAVELIRSDRIEPPLFRSVPDVWLLSETRPIDGTFLLSPGEYVISCGLATTGYTTGGHASLTSSLVLRFDDYCTADFNLDGGVDGADVEAFFGAWETARPEADVNRDGGVDGGDVEEFFRAWEAGCP